jgi:hypothetical protein
LVRSCTARTLSRGATPVCYLAVAVL